MQRSGGAQALAGAQGPCGKRGVPRRPGAIQRSGAQAPSRHLGLCSTLGVLRHSAGAQQAPKGLTALKGRSDTHKALRGCAALSRSTAAGTQQAVPRSGGAQQRAPSWRCSAQQALRRPAGTQLVAQRSGGAQRNSGALKGCPGALRRTGAVQCSVGAQPPGPSRLCSTPVAVRCPTGSQGPRSAQGRLGGAQGLSGAHQAPRLRAVLSKHLAAQQVLRGWGALWGRSDSQQAPQGHVASRGCSGAQGDPSAGGGGGGERALLGG